MIGVGSAKKRSKDNPGIGAGAAVPAALGCADLQNIGKLAMKPAKLTRS